jgi:hypothetical protein
MKNIPRWLANLIGAYIILIFIALNIVAVKEIFGWFF